MTISEARNERGDVDQLTLGRPLTEGREKKDGVEALTTRVAIIATEALLQREDTE